MSTDLPRRRWFRFTLGQLFVLTLGIAIGFVPLRLWELFQAPAPLLGLQVRIYEVPQSEIESLGLSADPSQVVVRPFNATRFQRINDLKESGALKVVVEPMLVTTSGRPASFHVGGELPIPADSSGVLAIEYREFGTRVEFVPTLLPAASFRCNFVSRSRAWKRRKAPTPRLGFDRLRAKWTLSFVWVNRLRQPTFFRRRIAPATRRL